MTTAVEEQQVPVEQPKSKKKTYDIYVYLGRGRYEIALVGAPDYDSCFGLARSQVRGKYPEAKLRFVPSGVSPQRKTRR
jgi:hypothetical protein